MQTILDLSYSKARKYFLESQNYCNLQLPVYIDWKNRSMLLHQTS